MSKDHEKRLQVGARIRAARGGVGREKFAARFNARLAGTLGTSGSTSTWRNVETGYEGSGREYHSTASTVAAMAHLVGLDPIEAVQDYGLNPDDIAPAVYEMIDEDVDAEADSTAILVFDFGRATPVTSREAILRRARAVLEEEFRPDGYGK